MANDERVDFPLLYGRTDGINIPEMTPDKLYCMGYNPTYGLINVHEDNGDELFEGRVNIETLLSQIQKKEIDDRVLDYIIKSYCKRFNIGRESLHEIDVPSLEVLTDKRQ